MEGELEAIHWLFLASFTYTLISLLSSITWSHFILYAPFLADSILGVLILTRLRRAARSRSTWILLISYSLLGTLAAVSMVVEPLLGAGLILFLSLLIKLVLDRRRFT